MDISPNSNIAGHHAGREESQQGRVLISKPRHIGLSVLMATAASMAEGSKVATALLRRPSLGKRMHNDQGEYPVVSFTGLPNSPSARTMRRFPEKFAKKEPA